MKTDKEAAEDYSYEYRGNSFKMYLANKSFLAGCKHKEESRWIPVSEKPKPNNPNDSMSPKYWACNSRKEVFQLYYNFLDEVWCDENFVDHLDITHHQPIIVPTPPQTNK